MGSEMCIRDSIQGDGAPGGLNHLGVEVEDTAKVQDAISRFGEQDLAVNVEAGVTCCYAVQDKVWVTDPDGAKWEFYTVLADAESMSPVAAPDAAACCASAGGDVAEPAAVDASACC